MKLSSIALGVPLLAGLVSAPAMACNKRKASAKPECSVYDAGSNRWHIYVPGYDTVAVTSGKYCAVGLAVPNAGVITSVDSVRMLRDSNGASINAWVFAKSPAVGTALNGVSAGNWQGFLGKSGASVAANISNLFCFTVTTKASTTKAQIEAALKQSKIGSDEANASGALQNNNRSIFTFTTVNENSWGTHARVFHNVKRANVATRATVDKDDVLYVMLPRNYRYGQEAATGFIATIQDQDASTAESVEFGLVDYASASSALPNVTAAGSRTSVVYTLFGSGSGVQARTWRLTTAVPVKVDAFGGVRVTLPAPGNAWPSDGSTIHSQTGDTVKLPAANQLQVGYRLSGSSAVAFGTKGSTHYVGGLYDCSTTEVAEFSNAYGDGAARIFGPEALNPNVSGNALVSFRIRSTRHKNSVALVLIAANYSTPFPSPFKAYLLTVFATNAVVPTDANGQGLSIGFPVGKGVQLAAQSVFFDFTNLTLEFSDACRFVTR